MGYCQSSMTLLVLFLDIMAVQQSEFSFTEMYIALLKLSRRKMSSPWSLVIEDRKKAFHERCSTT